MATRNARVSWTGTIQDGSGQVELTSSGVGTYPVSFPARTADEANGVTSPEELLAAAHASCFAMALSGAIGRAGGTPQALDIDAAATVNMVDGALTITGIKLTVQAEVDGLDEAGFKEAAQGAKENCPVSQALKAVDITLSATLN